MLDSSAAGGMQVDGLRCDMARPEDVAALEGFARDALGTVHLWCGPCEIALLHTGAPFFLFIVVDSY